MSEPATSIERRDDARLSTLERVFGTGDMQQMIAATRDNVNTAIAFAREREFVSEYPIVRNGRQVGVRLWFHHPTWQLLGQSFGITAYTEGDPTEVKPGVWQAAAVAATIENGQVVGRAVGMASRTETGKGKMTEHALSAIAQARAQRNALRSCLGAVLIAAGFEISDPEGPVTKEQLAKLHILEREMGVDHDEAHLMAGVTSYTKLNRDQASDVIDAWQAIVDELQGGGTATPSTSTDNAGATPRPEQSGATYIASAEETPVPESDGEAGDGAGASSPSASQPATAEAWARVPKALTLSAAVKLAGKMRETNRIPGPVPRRKSDFSGEQLAKVVAAYLDGERG